MSDLFTISSEEGLHNRDHFSDVLKVILSSTPSKSDTILSPAWVQVLGNAFAVYRTTDDNVYATELGRVWKTIWNFLESNDARTRKAAAESLGTLCHCFNPTLISATISDKDSRSVLNKIIMQATKALDSLAYAHSIPELLLIVSSLTSNLQYRMDRDSPSAAESLLLPLIKRVGDLRNQKGFEYREGADAALGTAMRVLGPKVLLELLPLNLEPSDRYVTRLSTGLSYLSNLPLQVKLVGNLALTCFLFFHIPTHHHWVTLSHTSYRLASACLTISQQQKLKVGNQKRKSGVSSSHKFGPDSPDTAGAHTM